MLNLHLREKSTGIWKKIFLKKFFSDEVIFRVNQNHCYFWSVDIKQFPRKIDTVKTATVILFLKNCCVYRWKRCCKRHTSVQLRLDLQTCSFERVAKKVGIVQSNQRNPMATVNFLVVFRFWKVSFSMGKNKRSKLKEPKYHYFRVAIFDMIFSRTALSMLDNLSSVIGLYCKKWFTELQGVPDAQMWRLRIPSQHLWVL